MRSRFFNLSIVHWEFAILLVLTGAPHLRRNPLLIYVSFVLDFFFVYFTFVFSLVISFDLLVGVEIWYWRFSSKYTKRGRNFVRILWGIKQIGKITIFFFCELLALLASFFITCHT